MALTKPFINDCRGVTLIELLIAAVMLSMVIGGSAAIYLSGARFLGSVRATSENFQAPNLNPITKRIEMGKQATVTQGGSQLNVLCDCNMTTMVPNTQVPDVPGDDTWAHFRVLGTNLRWSVDGNANAAVGAGAPALFSNLAPGSSFTLQNPSGQGSNTVVQTTLNLAAPPVSLKTRTALGGGSKR